MMLEIIAVGLVGSAAVALILPLFRTPEQNWEASRRAQGASTDQIFAERLLREQLAILRENVSEYVHVSGVDGWEEFLRSDIRIRVDIIGCIDPALAKQFVRVVSNLSHSDILYPDAYDKVYKMPVIPPITQDQAAYWRNVRKAAFTDL